MLPAAFLALLLVVVLVQLVSALVVEVQLPLISMPGQSQSCHCLKLLGFASFCQDLPVLFLYYCSFLPSEPMFYSDRVVSSIKQPFLHLDRRWWPLLVVVVVPEQKNAVERAAELLRWLTLVAIVERLAFALRYGI